MPSITVHRQSDFTARLSKFWAGTERARATPISTRLWWCALPPIQLCLVGFNRTDITSFQRVIIHSLFRRTVHLRRGLSARDECWRWRNPRSSGCRHIFTQPRVRPLETERFHSPLRVLRLAHQHCWQATRFVLLHTGKEINCSRILVSIY